MSENISVEQHKSYSGIKKVCVGGKGQFTIPADMRVRLGIGEDTILEVFQVGKAIVATPEKLTVKEHARTVRKEIAQKDIDILTIQKYFRTRRK